MSFVDSINARPSPLVPRDPPGGRVSVSGVTPRESMSVLTTTPRNEGVCAGCYPPLGGSEFGSGEGYSGSMSFADSTNALPSPLVPRDPPGGRVSVLEETPGGRVSVLEANSRKAAACCRIVSHLNGRVFALVATMALPG